MIHCCVCINTDLNNAKEATAVVDGYLLCEDHADLTQEDFARIIYHGGSRGT